MMDECFPLRPVLRLHLLFVFYVRCWHGMWSVHSSLTTFQGQVAALPQELPLQEHASCALSLAQQPSFVPRNCLMWRRHEE